MRGYGAAVAIKLRAVYRCEWCRAKVTELSLQAVLLPGLEAGVQVGC